jgi:hypothetical protein
MVPHVFRFQAWGFWLLGQVPMIWEWIAAKSTSLMALLIGIVFFGLAWLDGASVRYFCFCVALLAICYGLKQLRKHDTPFQKHEREIRRKQL